MKYYHNMSTTNALKELNSSPLGLTSKEAETRLKQYGQNVLQKQKKENKLLKFFSQFKDIMVIILLISSTISLIFSIIKHSNSELIDAIIIFCIVLINAFLGFFQEIKAENALESLKKMAQPFSTVLRDNKKIKVRTSEVVPGDIVLLKAGDVVPADILLLESTMLKCSESSLTGESEDSEKEANIILPQKTPLGDRKNMCYASTIVSYGRGKGVVTATGKDAEIGKIASLIMTEKKEETPLQKSLNKLGEIITFIVIGIAIIIFLVDVIFAHIHYIESFLTAIAIAVAAIPESLPAVVTIILSIGVTRLSKKNAIIKKLHAVETLGCCQIICSDKTGTITENKMTVKNIVVGANQKTKVLSKKNKPHIEILKCMVLCNNSSKQNNLFIGDPTENALLYYAEKNEISKSDFDKIFPRIKELPFDSNRKLMSTSNKLGDDCFQFTKGAIDRLLPRCKFIMCENGIREITENDKKLIQKNNKEMCEKALRVIGFATKEIKSSQDIVEDNLCFLGQVGMIDMPRKEVYQAIEKCKRAGLKTIMITGDHKETATAIAKQLNIIKSSDEVVNGSYLDKFSDNELKSKINKFSVFSRVSPEHKVRIVKALQSNGKIVAMTGDGVNDAPSIKTANIGIGMGKNGTDVTKEVADVILTDDNFATIVVAVEEGRKIFDNIQKTIQFLLSCNIAEVISIFLLTLIFPHFTLLNAVQILFINLVTDTLPSIALGMDKAENDIMLKPPRSPNQTLIGGRVGLDIVIQGAIQTIIIMIVYMIGIFAFSSPQVASTMAFLTINLLQLFHMYNTHSHRSIFEDSPFKNKFLNIAFILETLILILLAVVPLFTTFLKLSPLTINQWLIVLSSSLLVIPLCDIAKILLNKTKKHD